MNKINLVAGLLLAVSAAGANAAGTINSLSLVPATAAIFDFESEDGLVISSGSSYAVSGASLAAAAQFTVGQSNGVDLGENGLWGAGNHFLSFDNYGEMTLNVTFTQATKGFAFDFSAWQELVTPEMPVTTPATVRISYFDTTNTQIGTHSVTIAPSLGFDTYNQFLSTGYVSDSANIARISITGGGVVLDNLTFTAAVPEPESYAMLLAGLGLMGVVARRRSLRA